MKGTENDLIYINCKQGLCKIRCLKQKKILLRILLKVSQIKELLLTPISSIDDRNMPSNKSIGNNKVSNISSKIKVKYNNESE